MTDLPEPCQHRDQKVATYPYYQQSEDGDELIRAKVRYECSRCQRKTFKWFHTEGGRWLEGYGHQPNVLYGSTRVLPDEPLFVVEGEKDADTVYEQGFSAVSPPNGAGVWPDNFTTHILTWAPSSVTIIADADEPGRKFAGRVAESLAGKVPQLQMIEAPEGKDVTEWVQEYGGAVADLLPSAAPRRLSDGLSGIYQGTQLRPGTLVYSRQAVVPTPFDQGPPIFKPVGPAMRRLWATSSRVDPIKVVRKGDVLDPFEIPVRCECGGMIIGAKTVDDNRPCYRCRYWYKTTTQEGGE